MFDFVRKHKIVSLALVMFLACGAILGGGEIAKLVGTINPEVAKSCLSKKLVFAEENNNSPLTKEEQTIFSQNNIVFYEPCSSSGNSNSLSGEITISGDKAEEKVWSGLASFLTPEQAAGVLGNIAHENGNYGPVRREGGQGGDIWNSSTQMGMGLIQWSFGRRVKLLNYVKSQDESLIQYFEDSSLGNMSGDDFISKYGHDTANKIYQLEIQYLKKELDSVSSYHGIYDQKTVESASDFFLEHVEIPGDIEGQKPGRRASAQKMYDKYSNKTFIGNGVSSSTSGAANSDVTSSVHDKAWELADQPAHPDAEKAPTPAYAAAVKAVGGDKSTDQYAAKGMSCDMFVATVLKSSGVDENVPFGPVSAQQTYYAAHPEIYTPVEGDPADESIYQPGDIRIRDGHVEIYGQRDGKGHILSASHPGNSGGGRYAGYSDGFFVESGANYKIYRTKGTPKCNGGTNSCAQNSMDVVGTALCLAWPIDVDDKTRAWKGGSATDSFKEANDIVFKGHGNSKWGLGASCDKGTAVIIRYSGVDKKFPGGLGAGILDLAKKGSNDKWTVINSSSYSDLQPGDVALRTGHVWTYLGELNGKHYGAQSHYKRHYNGAAGAYLAIEESSHEKFNWILRPKDTKEQQTVITEELMKNAGKKSTLSNDGSTATSSGDSSSTSDTSTTSGSAEGKMDINASAIELSWPPGSGNKVYKSWNKAGGEYYKKLGRNGSQGGADCAEFGWTVLRHSGTVTKEENKKTRDIFSGELFTEHAADKWEDLGEVKKEDLKPGDVLEWHRGDPGQGGHHHIAFYVEKDGKSYIADASHTLKRFGNLRKFTFKSVPHVYRFKGANNSTGNSCDSCGNGEGDTAGDLGLKEGGMTLDEAKKWMDAYRKEAAKKKRGSYSFQNAYVYDAGCVGGTLNNCVAFSQWFLNKYTSLGPKWTNTVNGDHMVKHLGSSKGLKTGNEPRPYAVFSTGTYNHTGVVMGVSGSKVVVCEASCSNGYTSYWPGCAEWSMGTTKSKRMTYAYTDDILNSGGGMTASTDSAETSD